MATEYTKDCEILEMKVDAHGVEGVLNMLSEICSEKAEHLRGNWQDEREAKVWDKAGTRIAAIKVGPFAGR